MADEDYEIKPYVPLKDQAFADSNLPPEDFDAFSKGFDDGVEEEQPFEEPDVVAGDITTIVNLEGDLNFAGLEGVPEEYGDSISVEKYLETYFGEGNVPIEVGSEVMLAAAALDKEGDDIDHADDLVVVTAAPITYQVREEDGSVPDGFDVLAQQEWYIFLRKDNLAIFQDITEELPEGAVTILNFDGMYPRMLPLEDGGETRSVEEYAMDHIKHGFVPYSFAIGYKGYSRPARTLPGTIEFYNSNSQSVTGRSDWYIHLLPSNVSGGGIVELEEDEEERRILREKKKQERNTIIRRDRMIKDNTTRIRYWVNPKNGKVKASEDAPSKIWLTVPIVTTPNGNHLVGSLTGIIELCDQLGTNYSQVLSKSGNPIEVTITSDISTWKDNLKSLGGNRPITASESSGNLILKYR